MTTYVLGFYFRGPAGIEEVALIRKNRPHWQAGKLNGIGGKVEEDDDSNAHAMVREFYEEAKLNTNLSDWRKFGELHHDGNLVHLFMSRPQSAGALALLSGTDEEVQWYPVHLLHQLPVMANLHWMIPMALDKDQVTAVIMDCSRIPAQPAGSVHVSEKDPRVGAFA